MTKRFKFSGLELAENRSTMKKKKRQTKLFSTIALQFSTFCSSFKLVQRAFHSGSIVFLRLKLKSCKNI